MAWKGSSSIEWPWTFHAFRKRMWQVPQVKSVERPLGARSQLKTSQTPRKLQTTSFSFATNTPHKGTNSLSHSSAKPSPKNTSPTQPAYDTRSTTSTIQEDLNILLKCF